MNNWIKLSIVGIGTAVAASALTLTTMRSSADSTPSADNGVAEAISEDQASEAGGTSASRSASRKSAGGNVAVSNQAGQSGQPGQPGNSTTGPQTTPSGDDKVDPTPPKGGGKVPPIVRDHRTPKPGGPIVRDHRDPSGAPGGVTVGPSKPRPGSGPVVRDHRQPKPGQSSGPSTCERWGLGC